MLSDKPFYYNIETLAKLAGLTRRTIRYYVQRELIPKPDGGGRGHYYTDKHLTLIEKIKAWQEQGVPLEKMKGLLAGGAEPKYSISMPDIVSAAAPPISSSQWTKIRIGEDIELSFRQGALSDTDKKAIEKFIVAKIKR